MVQDLIVLEQEPVIRQQLELIKADIDAKIEKAMNCACTEDTYKDVKKLRASLNKDFEELEARRKEVKGMVMAPYEKFNEIYNEYVTNSFKPALHKLGERINTVESVIKTEKEAKVKTYFNELCQSYGIVFLSFSDTGIHATMSASVKSLKEEAKAFVTRVADDVAMIASHENAAEVMAEYKTDGPCYLNAVKAVTAVTERHRAIEAESKREAEQAEFLRRQDEAAAKVDQVVEAIPEFTAPTVSQTPIDTGGVHEPDDEKEYCMVFRVYATKTKLKELKKFLREGAYQYE